MIRPNWWFFQPFLESALLGGLLATVDVFTTEIFFWIYCDYLVLGVLEGVRHAGRAWTCWFPLGYSMYLLHVTAIALGQQPPYVEPTFLAARQTWFYFFPAGVGLIVGVTIRVTLTTAGWTQRAVGPPVRLLPRTTRGTIWAIAWVGVCFGFCRWLAIDAMTVYAPGFTEARFAQVHTGQTSAEVEALLGPPLPGASVKVYNGLTTWVYAGGVSSSCNYWRRCICFEADRVKDVIQDYWID